MGHPVKAFVETVARLVGAGGPALELRRLRWLGVWGPTAFGALLLAFTLAFHRSLPVWLLVLLVLSISAAAAALFSGVVFARIQQREEALREMNIALAHAMPGISRLDPEGRYVNVNEAYARMIGYEASEMIGMDWALTVHPDDRGNAITAYHRMVSEGKAEFEARAVRKDGSVFHKHVLMVKGIDKEGKLTGSLTKPYTKVILSREALA